MVRSGEKWSKGRYRGGPGALDEDEDGVCERGVEKNIGSEGSLGTFRQINSGTH